MEQDGNQNGNQIPRTRMKAKKTVFDLDVYDAEPLLANDPFRNALAHRTFYPEAVEDIAAFLAGEPVRVLE